MAVSGVFQRRSWLGALLLTLAGNALLFGLLPHLVQEPDLPEAPATAQPVRLLAAPPLPSRPSPSSQPAVTPKTVAVDPLPAAPLPELPRLPLAPPTLALNLPLSTAASPAHDWPAPQLPGVQLPPLAALPQYFEVDELDQPVQPLAQLPFLYPLRAKRQGIEGWVRLGLWIDRDGQVERVEILSAEPPGVFDETVLRGARQWRFRPGTRQGEPVASRVEQTVRFELQE
ncbi:MAG: energy transducer TonB [Desulfuromonas sp.]|nr:energy transducer TonB [Desulfuromonas thiophila]